MKDITCGRYVFCSDSLPKREKFSFTFILLFLFFLFFFFSFLLFFFFLRRRRGGKKGEKEKRKIKKKTLTLNDIRRRYRNESSSYIALALTEFSESEVFVSLSSHLLLIFSVNTFFSPFSFFFF
ncbi:hypothetical protein ES332_D12G247200v1 [Gossypium tomentosum]|uniref:Uncharacterized protein n=1 Tax=Gossypium tomentosum TaxID=34277 RepID=A0A5D2ID12_GOSTO|nr:hypothetical protein ES332_D12G247200v1 [Gossypium tomentosum]